MAKKLRRAFTIVELVIVIAVIAILAAVLIPTFTSLIQKANQSNDTTNVKNMNTILTAAEATDGKAETMYDAVQVIKEGGYDLSKLTPTGEGYDIVWDQKYNRLALVNDGEVVFSDSQVSTEKWKLWIVTDEQIETEYSVYLNDGFAGDSYTAASGVDVGDNEGINVTIETEGAKDDLKVRTNGGTLTVNAPNATVNHYEAVDTVNITAVAEHSYHEYGTVSRVSIASGHVEFMGGSSVKEIYVQADGCKITISDQVSQPSDILIVTAPDVQNVTVSKPATVADVIKETAVATFEELKEAVINGENTSYIKLTDNIAATESLTVTEGKKVVLNANGKTVTAGAGFTARFFVNHGTLTLKGNGTFDVSAAGANGYGTVNNYGVLTVEDGTYINLKESDASNFYNRNGGTATFVNPTINGGGGCIATEINTDTYIYGGYYKDETYPAIENRGTMLITAGTFVNTSCSSCDGRWGYTVRSGYSSDVAYLKIQGAEEDSVKVTGVQGGLAVIGGSADIYNGVYTTVACEIHGGASAFYAGYFTGESYKTATTIYGGTFQSVSKTAIQVGNGNAAPDSGAGEESTVIIYDGTFIGGDAAKTAVVVEKEQYAIGAAKISGGVFSSDPTKYVKEGHIVETNADGMFVVKEKI